MIEQLESEKIYLCHGPIQMVLDIEKDGKKRPDIGLGVVEDILDEFQKILAYMPFIKSYKVTETCLGMPIVLSKMISAWGQLGDESFTPLAAIAGSFSEYALECAMNQGATRVIINNGGDIALKDIRGKPFSVAIPLNDLEYLVVHIQDSEIGGICTSGIGGRSFTKGIANVAVAFGKTASIADICATYLGNHTNVESSEVTRCYAEEIDSGTDIPGCLVTMRVGNLDQREIYTALLNGHVETEKLIEKKIIQGSILGVKEEVVILPKEIACIKQKR